MNSATLVSKFGHSSHYNRAQLSVRRCDLLREALKTHWASCHSGHTQRGTHHPITGWPMIEASNLAMNLTRDNIGRSCLGQDFETSLTFETFDSVATDYMYSTVLRCSTRLKVLFTCEPNIAFSRYKSLPLKWKTTSRGNHGTVPCRQMWTCRNMRYADGQWNPN